MDPLTGAKLWLMVKPIKRLQLRRARKRAAKNGTTVEAELPPDFHLESADMPQGTMTKTGGVLAILGPILAVSLQLLGVGECSAEDLAQGCVGASQIGDAIAVAVGGSVSAIGGIMAWRGRNRAQKQIDDLKAAKA